MKKIYSFLFVITLMLFTSLSANAQEKPKTASEINKESQEFADIITQKLNLTAEQKQKTYQHFKELNFKVNDKLFGKEKNDHYYATKKKYESAFYVQMKKTLNENQLEIFTKIYKQNYLEK